MVSYPLDFSRGSCSEDYVHLGNFLNHRRKINSSTNTETVKVCSIGTGTDPLLINKNLKEFCETVYALLDAVTTKLRSNLVKNLLRSNDVNNNESSRENQHQEIPVIELDSDSDNEDTQKRIIKTVTQYSNKNKKLIDGQFSLLAELEHVKALLNTKWTNTTVNENNENDCGQQPVAVSDANRHEMITPEPYPPRQTSDVTQTATESMSQVQRAPERFQRAPEKVQRASEKVQTAPERFQRSPERVQCIPYPCGSPQQENITLANNAAPSSINALEELQELNTALTAINSTGIATMNQAAGQTANFSSYFGALSMGANSGMPHLEPATHEPASSVDNNYRHMYQWEWENMQRDTTSLRGKPGRVKYTPVRKETPYRRPRINVSSHTPLPRFPPPPIRPQPPPAAPLHLLGPQLYTLQEKQNRWLAHLQAFPNANFRKNN